MFLHFLDDFKTNWSYSVAEMLTTAEFVGWRLLWNFDVRCSINEFLELNSQSTDQSNQRLISSVILLVSWYTVGIILGRNRRYS